uniref:Serpentine receptor class gamma n=1 Tax=Panagrellus redivivus TaxID=6233 RepID=A0A7E4UUB9_PANRE
MLTKHFFRASSPLKSGYYQLILSVASGHSCFAIIYKSGTILMTFWPEQYITDESESLVLYIMSYCFWAFPLSLAIGNLLLIINRSSCLIAPVKYPKIWTPTITGCVSSFSLISPFIFDAASLTDFCRFRLLVPKCLTYFEQSQRYSSIIAMVAFILGCIITAGTLVYSRQRANTSTYKAERQFLFQAMFASAATSGFAVSIWLSTYFKTVGNYEGSCLSTFAYEGMYILYTYPSFISQWFGSPIFRRELIMFYGLGNIGHNTTDLSPKTASSESVAMSATTTKLLIILASIPSVFGGFFFSRSSHCSDYPCPGGNLFIYYYCSGGNTCSLMLQGWLFMMIGSLVLCIVISITCSIIKCICCRR